MLSFPLKPTANYQLPTEYGIIRGMRKMLTVAMVAATNALDFAVAILNAGLPENERIVIPSGE